MLYHCYRESKEPGEEVTVDHPYWHVNSMRTPRQPKQSTPSPSPDQVLFPREDIVEHQLLHQLHRSIPNHPVSKFRINQNCSQQLLATPLHFRVQIPLHSPSTSTSTSTSNHSLIHSPSIAEKTVNFGSFIENLLLQNCKKIANVQIIWNPFLSISINRVLCKIHKNLSISFLFFEKFFFHILSDPFSQLFFPRAYRPKKSGDGFTTKFQTDLLYSKELFTLASQSTKCTVTTPSSYQWNSGVVYFKEDRTLFDLYGAHRATVSSHGSLKL